MTRAVGSSGSSYVPAAAVVALGMLALSSPSRSSAVFSRSG
ncbi:hypothetical protein ACFQX7_13060 [Luedemannella flava]